MAVSYRHGIPRLETGWAKCVSDFRAQAEDVSLGFLGFRPGWCPSSESREKLVPISPMSLWFMGDISN